MNEGCLKIQIQLLTITYALERELSKKIVKVGCCFFLFSFVVVVVVSFLRNKIK